MRMMRGGGGNQALQHPREWVQNFVFIKRTILRNTRVRGERDDAFYTANRDGGWSKPREDQYRSKIRWREEQRIKNALLACHGHAHVGSGVMRPMKSPQP